jgi:hypothetical protein
MNPETNPYIPAAGSRPPVLAGREDELDTFTVALGRLGKGVHDVIGDHKLRLTFEDGLVGDIDFTGRKWRRVFEHGSRDAVRTGL